MAQMLAKSRQTVVRCCGIASTPRSIQPSCAGDVKHREHGCSCLARATAMEAYSENCMFLALKSQHYASEFMKASVYLNVTT